jgi:hypothetical protein
MKNATLAPATGVGTTSGVKPTCASGELQHNYVIFPGDVHGSALANMEQDPLMQKYWPLFEGHHTFRVENPSSGWDGKYVYMRGKKPSYEEDFAAPTSPMGPQYASGLAIAVSSQAELDAVTSAMKAKFGGAPDNVSSSTTTLDVADSGAPGEKRFSEFKREMTNVTLTTGLDGKPAFPGNFGPWVTLERTLDGKGTETIGQVVAPHIQSGKLPRSVTSVTYALNAEDLANTAAFLECCGFHKRQEGQTEVWIPRRPGAKIRLMPSADPAFQGLVCRSYSLNPSVLEAVRKQFGEGPIHRDFGFGVSLDIAAQGAHATLWLQKPPAPATSTADTFESASAGA